jgi:hypothetical protein
LVNVAEGFTVKSAAMRSEARAIVPEIANVENDWPAPRAMVWPNPVNVTEEPVDVTRVEEVVSQEPAMEIVEESKRRVAAPTEAMSPSKVAAALVRVRMADHARSDVKVALIPGLTMRLWRTWGIRMEPPEVSTTTVDVPTANVPAEVSMDPTVMMLPLAVSAPPLATVNVVAVIGRSEADVSRVVAPGLPWIVIAFATRPRAVIEKAIVKDPLLKTTALNSLPLRLAPAKVIIWGELALKVTVPDPADHKGEVESFVQLPETVHAPEPKAM